MFKSKRVKKLEQRVADLEKKVAAATTTRSHPFGDSDNGFSTEDRLKSD
ncbi:hypothetical protein SAMN05216232_3930 [Virgibacillus subterraneus]|uniref:Uncharacterized protein n=1 Tax=Virgibacillus subterraneus TaxID=621109 RepID=A0A1H9KMC5_9BACI|nr:hypothetical protein [Virgibacillus subterraneus]SER00326.1 hypothetical protein SAMN05216232_3930 [Virgibacillus subterraneus]